MAEHCPVSHDGSVFQHIGGSRRQTHNFGEVTLRIVIVDTAHLHLVDNGDRVNRTGIGEHLINGLKYVLILFQIEIFRAHLLNDIRNTPGVNEHGANHRLLCDRGIGDLSSEEFIHNSGLSLDDEHADISGDLVPELCLDRIGTVALDRIPLDDFILVNFYTMLRLERIGNLLRSHSTEKFSTSAGLCTDRNLYGRELFGNLPRLGLFPLDLRLFGLFLELHGVNIVGSGFRGDAARNEVIPGVSVRNLFHLAFFSFAFDILIENNFHFGSS